MTLSIYKKQFILGLFIVCSTLLAKAQSLHIQPSESSSDFSIVDSIPNSDRMIYSPIATYTLKDGIERDVFGIFCEDGIYIGMKDDGVMHTKFIEIKAYGYGFYNFSGSNNLLLFSDHRPNGGDGIMCVFDFALLDVVNSELRIVGFGPAVNVTDNGFTIPVARILNAEDCSAEHIHIWHDVEYDVSGIEKRQSRDEYATDKLIKKYSGLQNILNGIFGYRYFYDNVIDEIPNIGNQDR